MAASEHRAGTRKRHDTRELIVLQSELVSLETKPHSYPFECLVGSLQFLFECPEDIEILVENLADEITDGHLLP